MNILPLILAFIIVFTLCSSLFMEEKKSTLLEEKHYSSFMLTERKLRNLLEKKQFVKASPTKKENNEKKPKTLKKDTVYISRRQISYPNEAAKLNIQKLLVAPNEHLYEAAAALIKSLYSHKAFYTKDLEYQVIDTIIEEAKKKKDKFSFSSLPFSKIIKGTTYYNIETKEGYPPLQDYIFIDAKSKPANFCYAATPVLAALLGKDLAKKILEDEKAKWEQDHKHHTITKDELSNYKIPLELYDLFNFSKHTPPKKEETLTDPLTKISIKKHLPNFNIF